MDAIINKRSDTKGANVQATTQLLLQGTHLSTHLRVPFSHLLTD